MLFSVERPRATEIQLDVFIESNQEFSPHEGSHSVRTQRGKTKKKFTPSDVLKRIRFETVVSKPAELDSTYLTGSLVVYLRDNLMLHRMFSSVDCDC